MPRSPTAAATASVIGETDERRLAAIERAIELDDPPQPARRARLLALQALELLWDADFRRRWALADEAIALARETGDARTLAVVLRQAFYAYWSAQTLELRSAHRRRASPIAQPRCRIPALQFWAHIIELYVYVEHRGSSPVRRQRWSALQRIAEELGQPTLRWFSTFRDRRLGAASRRSGGRRALGRARVSDRTGGGRARRDPDLRHAARLRHPALPGPWPGDHRDAREEGERLSRPSWPGAPASPRILCWLDRRAEATAILKQAASDRFEHVLPASDELTALVLYADAAVQTGDADAALDPL